MINMVLVAARVACSATNSSGFVEIDWNIVKRALVRNRLQSTLRSGSGLQLIQDVEGDRTLLEESDTRINIRYPSDIEVSGTMERGMFRFVGATPTALHLENGSISLDAHALESTDITVAAGNIDAKLQLMSGDHKFQVRTGTVTVSLDPASSCRILTTVQLGATNVMLGKRTNEGLWIVGEGKGLLSLSSQTGAIIVTPIKRQASRSAGEHGSRIVL
jgi:hypothetical protein